jgi:hypothetical protein
MSLISLLPTYYSRFHNDAEKCLFEFTHQGTLHGPWTVETVSAVSRGT